MKQWFNSLSKTSKALIFILLFATGLLFSTAGSRYTTGSTAEPLVTPNNESIVLSATVTLTPTATPKTTLTPTATPGPTPKPTTAKQAPFPTTSRPTPTTTPTTIATPALSNDNYYTNSSGNQVHSPAYSQDNSAPAGATAICGDGTYSFSQSRRGTCSHHGGVAQWL